MKETPLSTKANLLKQRKAAWATVVIFPLVGIIGAIYIWTSLETDKGTFVEQILVFGLLAASSLVGFALGIYLVREANKRLSSERYLPNDT